MCPPNSSHSPVRTSAPRAGAGLPVPGDVTDGERLRGRLLCAPAGLQVTSVKQWRKETVPKRLKEFINE